MEMKTSRKMPHQKVVWWLLAALGFLGNVDIARCDAGSKVPPSSYSLPVCRRSMSHDFLFTIDSMSHDSES